MSEEYYKIWLHVERINESSDTFSRIGEPIDLPDTYATKEDAKAAVELLLNAYHVHKHCLKGAK